MVPVSPCARIVPLFAGGLTSSPSFEVPPVLSGRWRQLAAAVRCHVGAFLGDHPVSENVVVAPREMPASFTDDLVRGGPRLRAAFPDLVRRVVAIEDEDTTLVTIRVECVGTHTGAFFAFMMPTGRAVRFEATHLVRVVDGALVEDRLQIDLRAIVRQLGRG